MSWSIPQQQLSDLAPPVLRADLIRRVRGLPGVDAGPSRISVPGAEGFRLAEATGPPEAFLVPLVREIGHVHPDGPRTPEEVEIVAGIVATARRWTAGRRCSADRNGDAEFHDLRADSWQSGSSW